MVRLPASSWHWSPSSASWGRPPANRQRPRHAPPAAFGAPGNIITVILDSASNPTRNPAGANDYSCRPSAAHPNPVVLVHGTFGNAYDSWSGLAPVLRFYGYCVFAVNYGAPAGSIFKGTTGKGPLTS